MNRKRLSLVALSALVTLAGAVLGSSSDTTLKEIAGYRQWTRVTTEPIQVNSLWLGG